MSRPEIRNGEWTAGIPTSAGEFQARYSAAGLCGLAFPGRTARRHSEASAALPAEIQRWHAATVKALNQALAGQALAHPPPLDLSRGTDFQQRVWQTLRKIAPGQTWSYAEVAQAIGNPNAVRAVGGACGANPIPVFVPCHRVLAANHRLGGFSGGLHWKRKLLAVEGLNPAEYPSPPLRPSRPLREA